MIIYTEITHGYLMHLYAVLAEAGVGGVAQWSYGAFRQGDTLVHTLPWCHTSEDVQKPSNDKEEKDLH